MEESLIRYYKEQLNIKKVDIRTYSPLTLAYIGDSVYDLLVKTMIVSEANMPANKYHKKTSSMVRAQAQAEMIQILKPHLSEEELDVYKRGRNAQSYSKAKNATMIDYRRATGFEALVGYLYLQESYDRLVDLLKIGFHEMEKASEEV